MAKLILNGGKPSERSFGLIEGENTVGRTRDNQVFVSDKSLSRKHVRLTLKGGHATIEDLGSKNGTFVDGELIDKRPLSDAHHIKCGDIEFLYLGESAFATAPTAICGDSLAARSLSQMLEPPNAQQPTALNLRQDSDRPQQKLQILLKVSELLSTPSTLDKLLGRIVDLAFQILDIDRGVLLLGDALTPRVTRTRRGQPMGAFSRQIVNYVVDHGVAASFDDAQADPRVANAGSIVQQTICCAMCAPIKPRGGRAIGALYVDNLSQRGRFTEDDLEFLSAFASQAAIAIDNATLSDELAHEVVARNSLMRFFPPSTVDAIIAGGASLETIETEATMLFCDISGFTELSARRPPRQLIQLLNGYLPVMADIVFRHGGTLEKYIGDALFAVWGAPIQRDDDALRAVSAAVEMQRAAHTMRDQWPELAIHIGINSGPVAAGQIGTERYLQYATIGDATNMAARICGVASVGQILINASTHALLSAPPWPCTALDPVTVKGKSGPLQLYRVDAPS